MEKKYVSFFKISCPNCGHSFVWLEHTCKGTSDTLYRRKGHDEQLESTMCPKCNMKMVVLKDSAIGIDIRNEIIEVADIIRGI